MSRLKVYICDVCGKRSDPSSKTVACVADLGIVVPDTIKTIPDGWMRVGRKHICNECVIALKSKEES